VSTCKKRIEAHCVKEWIEAQCVELHSEYLQGVDSISVCAGTY
jgi:hypothetical protein